MTLRQIIFKEIINHQIIMTLLQMIMWIIIFSQIILWTTLFLLIIFSFNHFELCRNNKRSETKYRFYILVQAQCISTIYSGNSQRVAKHLCLSISSLFLSFVRVCYKFVKSNFLPTKKTFFATSPSPSLFFSLLGTNSQWGKVNSQSNIYFTSAATFK